MLVYLNLSFEEKIKSCAEAGRELLKSDVTEAVLGGAGRRVRPIIMTFASIFAGLIPIMITSGTGSEVMQRIAGPMIGGMLSTLLLVLLVIPAVYFVWKSWGMSGEATK